MKTFQDMLMLRHSRNTNEFKVSKFSAKIGWLTPKREGLILYYPDILNAVVTTLIDKRKSYVLCTRRKHENT
jgi:hypothetical protein